MDGIRETKTVNGVKHTYTYLGEKLARETYGSNVIDYFYDSDGRPYKFTVKEGSTTYTGYFVLNLQGDVIAIIDSNGAVAVEYEYDAWGKEISHTTSGSYGSKLYSYNVLKYRGYYYDAETGFYYVSSRYYDPEVGRFISADTTDVLTVSQTSLREKNLYAYCNNNPIINADQNGTFAHVVIGAVVGAGFEIAAQLVANNGDFGSINWGKVGVATAVGGITTLTGPLLGAAISGAGNGAMEALSGTTSLSKVMTSIAVGAGASLIGTGVGEVTKKIGGKIVVKSLEKKGSTVIKNTVLSKISVKGTERNMVKNLTWAVKKYPKLPGALLGKNIPQTFNSLAVGISGYGTMGAIYGIK